MSVALYRKYRPGSFGEVRGQEHVTEPLRQALRTGRINHAYLFSGPRGCGKTTSARILARSLNCAEGPTPDPCGGCDSCAALAPDGSGSVDVIEIDAASHGGVDDARELRERAFFAPVSSRYKIYIVDEAHMVTREGFNALLKLVEEPPAHLKFIFATTEPDKVISTIRSRTHHYPFRLIAPSTLRRLMEGILTSEGVAYDPAALPLVVRAGAGSARDSLSVLDQLLAGSDERGITRDGAVSLLGYTDSSLLSEMVGALGAQDGAAVFELIDRVVEAGNDPRRFTADLLERIRDLIVLTAVPDALDKGLINVSPDSMEGLQEQARDIGHSALTHAANNLSEGLTQMRGATAPRLQLELICARILFPATPDHGQASPSASSSAPKAARSSAATGTPTQDSAASAQSPPVQSPPAQAPRTQDAPTVPPSTAATQDAGTSPPPTPPRVPATGDTDRPEATPVAATTPNPAHTPASATAATPSGGDAQSRAVRDAWPRIMEAVKSRRRFTWMILAGDGVGVLGVDGKTLRIGFPRANDAKGFSRSGSDQILQSAINDVLGVELHVVAVDGEVAAPPAPTSQAAPPDSFGTPSVSSAPAAPRPGPPATSGTVAEGDDQPPPPAEPMPGGDDGGMGGSTVATTTHPPVSESGPANGPSDSSSPVRNAARGGASRTAPNQPAASSQGPPTLEPVTLIQNELGGRLVEEIDHEQDASP